MVLGIDGFEQGSQEQNAREFRDLHGLTYPILLDPDHHVVEQYGITGWPSNILIDQEGVVRFAGAGFNSSGLEQTIHSLLGDSAKSAMR